VGCSGIEAMNFQPTVSAAWVIAACFASAEGRFSEIVPAGGS